MVGGHLHHEAVRELRRHVPARLLGHRLGPGRLLRPAYLERQLWRLHRGHHGRRRPERHDPRGGGASIGAANIKVASVTGFAAGDWIAIGAGGTDEVNITSVGTAGAGGTGISFTPVTIASHGNNAPVTQIDGPHDPGGVGGENPTWSITINSINYTGQIPAESIVLSESGSDATATLEFTVESFDDDGIPVQSSGSEFPDDTVLLTNLDTGVRYFGGILVGCTRRHLPGSALAQDVRAVSYDSWLDRRYLPSWWTTTTLLKTGNKLADDRLIVQRIVKDGCAWLVANDTDVKSTNVAMPKLNLTDGSLRDHILATAEAAATVGDPTARRVYVDFYQHVHYFKGSETRSAPYRIGDADYARTLRATTGLVAFWSLGESSGAVCRGNTATSITLSGTYVRNVTGGVVNYPKSGGVSFGAASSGLATAAALHPGNVFSVECWFKRNTISTQQTLFSAGSGDYTIEFTAANLLAPVQGGHGRRLHHHGHVHRPALASPRGDAQRHGWAYLRGWCG